VPATPAGGTGDDDVIWSIDGAPDPLSFATRLAMDDREVLYVLDNGHNRVRAFDKDGKALGMWGVTGAEDDHFIVYCPGRDCPPACSDGNCLHLPGNLAVDRQGSVYVADVVRRKIEVFDDQGRYLREFAAAEQLAAEGLRVDLAGNVWVLENASGRLRKFDRDRRELGRWGSLGGGPGQLNYPRDVVIGHAGDVYVVDMPHGSTPHTGRVQKWRLRSLS
jgi:sugar lactone lactonase YvrE